MRRFAPLVLIAGVILLLIGILDYNQEAGAKPEPDVITAADLVAKGPPANVHVRITESAPAFNEAVKLTTTKRGATTSEDVFLPLTTTPARFGDKPALAAIVRMKPNELTAYRGGPVQGMRIKALTGLNSKVADRLATTYGKDTVEKAFYLQYNRKPTGLGTAMALIAGGVVALAAGILMYLKKPDPTPVAPNFPPPPAAPYPPAGSYPPPPPPAR